MLETIAQATLIACGVFLAAIVGLTMWKTSQHRPPPIAERQPSESQAQRTVNSKDSAQQNQSNAERTASENHNYPAQKVNGSSHSPKDENENYEKALANYTFWLTAFTAILAISTVGLVVATAGLWSYAAEQASDTKNAIAESRRSADAAKQSADAIANIERPYIFIIAKPSKIATKDGPAELNPTISYTYANLGRVPAVIRLIYAQCFLAQQLNPNPTYPRSKFHISQNPIGAGLTSADPLVCEFEAPLTAIDWADIIANKKSVVFTAIFLYEGALDYTYVTAVTYKIDMFTGKAYPIGGAAYNYDHSERGRITHGAQFPLPNIVP